MHSSRILVGGLGLLLLAVAGSLEGLRCHGGTVIAEVPIGADRVARFHDVALPAGVEIAPELASDFHHTQDVTLRLDGTLRSDAGEVVPIAIAVLATDGGSSIGNVDRGEPFTPRTSGRWSGELVLSADEPSTTFQFAAARLRTGVWDVGGLAALFGVPGLLALLLALVSERIEWAGWRARS